LTENLPLGVLTALQVCKCNKTKVQRCVSPETNAWKFAAGDLLLSKGSKGHALSFLLTRDCSWVLFHFLFSVYPVGLQRLWARANFFCLFDQCNEVLISLGCYSDMNN